jgi:capsular exopolysaccharide synthesis family protein
MVTSASSRSSREAEACDYSMTLFTTALERAEEERSLRSVDAVGGGASDQPAAGEVAAVEIPPPPPAKSLEIASPATEKQSPSKRRQATPRPQLLRAEPDAGHQTSRASDQEGRKHAQLVWTRMGEQLVSLLAPGSFEAEQYRILRNRVEQFRKSAAVSVVAVSSPTAGDGKTTTAINLAGSLAQGPNARVLLIDADVRGPSVTRHLAVEHPEAPGLVEAILDGGVLLDSVTQTLSPLNLCVIPAGRRPASPYDVLQSPRIAELLAAARARFDYIIVDTPPLVSVPDCRVIGKWVDGFLIVVAAHKTTRKLLQEALRVVEPEKVLGLVFNGDDHHFSKDYYAYPLNGSATP